MRKSHLFNGILGLIASLAAITPTSATETPDLKGNWKGTSYAVIIGSTNYRTAEHTAPTFAKEGIEFTLNITDQQGNRFAGTLSGGNYKETIIGAVHPDNKSGIIVDDEGPRTFNFKDRNTIEFCYGHSTPSNRVAGCWAAVRVP